MTSENNDKLGSLFGKEDILCQTSIKTGDEVVRALLKVIAHKCGSLELQDIERSLQQHMHDASPVIPGTFVAIPHARLDNLPNMIVAIATSPTGMTFGKANDSVAKIVILILGPSDQPGLYLQAVSGVARSLGDRRTVERVAGLKSAEEIWDFFNGRGLELPPYVCAADIMRREFTALHDTDTLERAIDLFASEGLMEIPVLDRDGDLVGVVAENELLHVCLPDYILWMEDLSPIINFQPFVDILKSEGKTWLQDIMTSEYVSLPCEAPAIQVAREMARRDLHHVYVLNGKKLDGIITLQDFINKVLRE